MEDRSKRLIRDGKRYDHLFPKAKLIDITLKRGAMVEDTVRLIPKVVQMTRWQTKKYVEQELRGLSTYDACEKLWHFIYDHIAYRKDETNKEQIRSPRRSWHERVRGVDCDCYTTFISTVLTNLGIPHLLRIAKYSEDHFQHIYPVVPMPDGNDITIDCVVKKFNYEEPYTEIKDTIMDLQFLDGIDDNTEDLNGWEDELYAISGIEELYGDDELNQLGFLKKLLKKAGKGISQGAKFVGKKVIANSAKTVAKGISKGAKAVAKATVKAGGYALNKIKEGAHALNKFNLAAILLRNGLLAALKLNMFNVAGGLRLSYLNKTDAANRNLNPSKHNSLINIRQRLESILYTAGGKDSDLKSAILKSKGNQGSDKVLAGLDGIDDDALSGMDENTPIGQLLGEELFGSINIVSEEDLQGLRELDEEQLQGVDGSALADTYQVGQELYGLGEPATISIAAASGALATIAGLIKSLGNLYQKGKDVVDTVKPVTDIVKSVAPVVNKILPDSTPDQPSESNAPQPPEIPPALPQAPDSTEQPDPPDKEDQPQEEKPGRAPAIDKATAVVISNPIPTLTPIPSKTLTIAAQTTPPATPPPGFWDKNKGWLKPALWGAGGLGLLYVGYHLITKKDEKQTTVAPKQNLSGVKRKKKKQKDRKKPVDLM